MSYATYEREVVERAALFAAIRAHDARPLEGVDWMTTREAFERSPMGPVARIVLTFSDGATVERVYERAELADADMEPDYTPLPPLLLNPPPWLFGRSKIWPEPWDPITFTGRVVAGFERDAQEALGIEPLPDDFILSVTP